MLPGNLGYLRFDGFFPLKDGGHDTADAAMTFLQRTSALIIDLRANRGGDPAVGELLIGYLFDKRVHFGDFLSRPDGSKTENWISPHSLGARYEGDVYILVSKDTISAAEGFAMTCKASAGPSSLVNAQLEQPTRLSIIVSASISR